MSVQRLNPIFQSDTAGLKVFRYAHEVPSCANMHGRFIILMYRKL